MTTYTDLIAAVRADWDRSDIRWEAAVESDARWADDAATCSDAYAEAIDALRADDLDTAETALEAANMSESRGGDNCDAHHALGLVRAAMGG